MTLSLGKVFGLLVLFQFKHLAGDYLLQTRWMILGKSKPGIFWIIPLAAHCAIHTFFSLVLILLWNPSLWYLCFLDFATHFTMDRVKASPHLLGRFPFGGPQFFLVFGIDQMVHHLSDYWIAYLVLASLIAT